MKFQFEDGRIYAQDQNGKTVAEITFPPLTDTIVNLDHTFVDSSLRGQGVAENLVLAAAIYIRLKNLRVIPTCSYVRKWFCAHPEYADLLVAPVKLR